MGKISRTFSGKSKSAAAEEAANKEINETLKKEKLKQQVKLLLLGAGDSGKSTIFKQMQIIHNNGYSDAERQALIPIIRNHCIENFRDIVTGAKRIDLLPKDIELTATTTLKAIEVDGLSRYVPTMTNLWRSESFVKAFAKRSMLQVSDSAQYFMENLARVAAPDFVPTNEDILMCRVRTTGVSELCFSVNGVNFRMVDVGGQRNERRKWIHCFEDVHAVIFVAAINEYDQVLFEDEKVNRLKEALRLFSEVVQTKFFTKTPIVLFLNKHDLFVEKIRSVDLMCCFPEYTGGCDAASALQLIRSKFLEVPRTKDQELFIHITTATNTHNVSFVFHSVEESILFQNVSSMGML